MKHQLLILSCLFFFSSIYGQETFSKLTPQQEKKANKNAELEIKMLPKKGWVVNRSDITFEEMMHQAWRKKFAMIDSKTPYFIYSFGNGKGKTIEEAYNKASKKANAQLPGLILLYFNMWNMASNISQDEKDKISSAIGKSEKQITKQLESLQIEPFVNMTRNKNGKHEIHLRFYYPQIKTRDIARELIISELSKITDWSKKKMISVLTYDK
ncbi:MAG: hypothetical protein KAH17_09415 [Bacteroidales bacterium]|nr:hypothetical protein [Bacteroidales bacterium]